MDPTSGDNDGGGHRRPYYRHLARYAAALARRIDPSLPMLGEMVTTRAAIPTNEQPPARVAAEVCVAAWSELADVAAGNATASATLDSLASTQSADGPLFAFDKFNGDNPEPWWYHELVALHALTSYGRLTHTALATHSAQRAAAFHHAETQPDHATGQPWAIHAFAGEVEMIPTAELLLLACGIGRPGGVDIVSRLLLADACVWLDGGPDKVAKVQP